MKGKYLISTEGWFYASNGKQYKAAWGEVEIVLDEILGIKTNRNASNWYAKVGNSDNHVIIAGCQIHYAVKSENKPNTEFAEDYLVEDGVVKVYNRPANIYIAE